MIYVCEQIYWFFKFRSFFGNEVFSGKSLPIGYPQYFCFLLYKVSDDLWDKDNSTGNDSYDCRP